MARTKNTVRKAQRAKDPHYDIKKADAVRDRKQMKVAKADSMKSSRKFRAKKPIAKK